MAALPPTELLRLWKLEELPIEMSIGHILQNLVAQQTTQETFQQTLLKLRMDIDRLMAHTRLPPPIKGKPKPSKPDETPEPEQSS